MLIQRKRKEGCTVKQGREESQTRMSYHALSHWWWPRPLGEFWTHQVSCQRWSPTPISHWFGAAPPQGLGCRNSQALLLQEGKGGFCSRRADKVFQELVNAERVKGLKEESTWTEHSLGNSCLNHRLLSLAVGFSYELRLDLSTPLLCTNAAFLVSLWSASPRNSCERIAESRLSWITCEP